VRIIISFLLAAPLFLVLAQNGEYIWFLPLAGLQMLSGLNFVINVGGTKK